MKFRPVTIEVIIIFDSKHDSLGKIRQQVQARVLQWQFLYIKTQQVAKVAAQDSRRPSLKNSKVL